MFVPTSNITVAPLKCQIRMEQREKIDPQLIPLEF